MSLSLEQLVETAFIRAFPGQSQAMKDLYRFEIILADAPSIFYS